MTTWDLKGMSTHLFICNGSSCMRKGGEELTQAIRNEIELLQLDEQIHTTRTRCNGRCQDACIVISYPEGVWYRVESPEIGRQIVRDQNEQSLNENIIYQFVNGEMAVNPASRAPVGISKKK
ncbi:(2Fe-2S) ferredoxin domain-containing protein [Bacillus sp. B15-48]|uniref:(2Fe-2S) ferredoxin domain-containing protein n=1 Tax=Bacillus sp. B15-48 TaxID=1548601 RepID=UPI00193F0FD0|nr:(2Fe-2S) ferredoxin domain-containing protein [Bacillus sp. B15-48]MBM4762987.1 (2Fe-2S) ferredoxin domain-containing protein [Bacillus sp. B15-48]